jgi:hypothetical protein
MLDQKLLLKIWQIQAM